ncbi:hypothetical protein C0J52_05821 [Blattella germanica]|nr:hypothetical protein C0J52_05821 [Blattella germanica]
MAHLAVSTGPNGVFVSAAWTKYVDSPIVTSVETTHFPLYELPFPAITICPANKLRRIVGEEILSRYLNVSLNNNSTREIIWHAMSVFSIFEHPFYDRMSEHLSKVEGVKDIWNRFDHFNVSQFMLQVLPTCSELFLNCYWHGKRVECCEVLHIQRCEAGFCYSFNSLTSEVTKHCANAEELEERGRKRNKDPICFLRRTTGAGTTTGFEVYFKGSNKSNSMKRGQRDQNGARVGKGLLLSEGEGTVFTVKVSPSLTASSEVVRNLMPEERQCYFHDEMHLDIHHAYSQYACLLECKLKYIAKTLDVPECSLKELLCVVKHEQELRFFSPPENSMKNPEEERTSLQCSYCLPTCRETTYQVQSSFDRDYHPSNANAKGYLDVYYKDLGAVKYQRQLAFDGMNLLVSFGGIAGLFLGVSLLTVVEMAYYSVRLAWAIYNNVNSRRNKSSKIQYPSTQSIDIQRFTAPSIIAKIEKTEHKHNGCLW